MHSTREQLEGGGSGGELRGLRDHSRASAQELRDFLASLKGKSPQEAVGLVATSGLAQGIVWATCGFAVVLAGFTVGPYLMRDGDEKQGPTAPPAAAAAAAAAEPATPSAAQAPADQQPGVDLDQASRAMGIDEAKTAAPNANPLDKDLDKLLEIDD